MKLPADLHFHSKYSRAVSPQMTLPNIAEYGKIKGLKLLTATDFTHPLWFEEIKNTLTEIRDGIYQLRNSKDSPFFILTTEISLIYQNHRIHLLVFSPNIETVTKINEKLSKRGFNLLSDGRPILGINCRDFVALLKEVDERIIFVPAHIWTPWFSLYGSKSGYDTFTECFLEYSEQITAFETGLSSDPIMNWQIAELDKKIIVSFSDAHSLKNLGREATVFELPKNFTYTDIIAALKTPHQPSSISFVSSSVEFYPEEGKYHLTGHRKCKVCQTPEETKKLGVICPVCRRPLTVGVMHRVQKLSREKTIAPVIKEISGIKTFYHPENSHHPFICLVPLLEIIAEAESLGVSSKKVLAKYQTAIKSLGSEFDILTKVSSQEISHILGKRIGEGIEKNHRGDLFIAPGYDGVYGKVKIWGKETKPNLNQQASLF